MKTPYTVALLACVASAAPNSEAQLRAAGKLSSDPKYNDYVARFNKNPTSSAMYQRRLENYHNADATISENNRASKISGNPRALILAHNQTSDWSRREYLDYLTLDQQAAEAQRTTLTKGDGRRLEAAATDVDHYADGWMYQVKNQGICGSCWAFAASTALEGTRSKLTGSSPVRLSEQQLVDCTVGTDDNYSSFDLDYFTWGCEGGWMDYAFDFWKKYGIMTYDDYPYTSRDSGVEGECSHDETLIEGYVLDHGQIYGSTDDVKVALVDQPLTVALDAGSAAFQWYSSGVIGPNDNCGTELNHAVVLVGYTDSGIEPPAPAPQVCKVRKWWYTCRDMTEEEETEWCAQEENTCEEETDDSTTDRRRRRRMQDSNGNDVYWKIQNSWDTTWGDNGFGLIQIEEGTGVCGINSVVEWVDWQLNDDETEAADEEETTTDETTTDEETADDGTSV